MKISLNFCFVIILLSLSLLAQGNGKGKGHANRSTQTSNTAVNIAVIFSDSDRRSIQQWAQASPGLPPGLAKRGQLPPGLQKQLRRNGTLPLGLQKKISSFPQDLNSRLGPLPVNCACDRVFLDGKAMIIARATSAILDVISIF